MGNSAGLGGAFRAAGKASGKRIGASVLPATAAAILAAPKAPVALKIDPFRKSRRDRPLRSPAFAMEAFAMKVLL
jgi:hypothetical protein